MVDRATDGDIHRISYSAPDHMVGGSYDRVTGAHVGGFAGDPATVLYYVAEGFEQLFWTDRAIWTAIALTAICAAAFALASFVA